MNGVLPGSGEMAALAAAALWACSSLFYSKVRLTAWQINFGKNVLASGILLLHLSLQSLFLDTPLLSVDRRAAFWLVLSSLTGIVIGDTLYFPQPADSWCQAGIDRVNHQSTVRGVCGLVVVVGTFVCDGITGLVSDDVRGVSGGY